MELIISLRMIPINSAQLFQSTWLNQATPKEVNEWEHSVVGQFADTRRFTLKEVRTAVNLFWSRGFMTVEQKGQLFLFRCSNPLDREEH